MSKSLVKILIGLCFLTSDVIAAASVGYGRGSDQSSWDFGDVSAELKEKIRGEESAEILKTHTGKSIVSKIDGNATTNVLKMTIFIEPEKRGIIVLSVPVIYLSGWGEHTKRIDKIGLSEAMEVALKEPIGGIGFSGDAFADIEGYKTDLEELFSQKIAGNLGNSEGIRSFIYQYSHTEPAAMVSLQHILPTLRGISNIKGKIKNIGILLVSYLPPCGTCRAIINRETEIKYYLSKAELSPIFKEEDIGYFIRIRSVVSGK